MCLAAGGAVETLRSSAARRFIKAGDPLFALEGGSEIAARAQQRRKRWRTV